MKVEMFRVKNVMIFLLLSLAGLTAAAQQQSYSFTQYMDNLTPFNPAYSLINNVGEVNTDGRKQWAGITGSPTALLFDANVPFQDVNAAAGLTVTNDAIAIEQETQINAYFAKAIQLGPEDYLAVSLNAGLRNYVADYSTLASDDPSFKNDIRETKPNVGFGIMYYTDGFYLGFSLPELTINSLGTASVQSSNNNFANQYYFSGAFITSLDQDIKLKGATLVSLSNGTPATADFSAIIYLKDEVGIGFDYRTNKQLAGIITININSFHIGYSYQVGLSSQNLGGVNLATQEVSLGYRFGKGSSNIKLL
jgi:type IX secretion system PorP/SprF family membrane protein